MKYIYFVSYNFATSCGQTGFGNRVIKVNNKISSYKDIRELEDYIVNGNALDFAQVCILNYQLLNKNF